VHALWRVPYKAGALSIASNVDFEVAIMKTRSWEGPRRAQSREIVRTTGP
jgi:hypothetical protein